jgi:hypothetical protein
MTVRVEITTTAEPSAAQVGAWRKLWTILLAGTETASAEPIRPRNPTNTKAPTGEVEASSVRRAHVPPDLEHTLNGSTTSL